MGNTLDSCGHLLNDLYPHIFSFFSPRELAAVSLVSRQLRSHITDEVWKELCRRDFGRQLCLYRQTAHRQRSQAIDSDSTSTSKLHDEDDDDDGEMREEENEELRHQKKAKTHAPHQEGDSPVSYKELYRSWANEVLIIYHVFSADSGAADVAHTLEIHGGIRAATLLRTESRVANRAGELQNLKAQLEAELPKYKAVMYISNGGVSSVFQSTIGDELANFVDEGGAVILFPFATATEKLLGRWDVMGLNPINSDNQTSVLSSLRHPVPDHPLFKNVHNIKASFRGTGRKADSATTIAHYEDGTILAAELKFKRGFVLAINLFPPSTPQQGEKGRDGGWDATPDNDVPALLTNAVRYAIKCAIDTRTTKGHLSLLG